MSTKPPHEAASLRRFFIIIERLSPVARRVGIGIEVVGDREGFLFISARKLARCAVARGR
jgi:hypothetical protein